MNDLKDVAPTITTPSQPSVNRGRPQARVMASDDPNLDPNWNWEAQNWGTIHYLNPGGAISTVNSISNPFYAAYTSPASNNTPSLADIHGAPGGYTDSGWVLVSRDFGVDGSAPNFPYLILYNKWRGILRACIYRTDNNSSASYQKLTLYITVSNSSNFPNRIFKFANGSIDYNNNTNNNSNYTQTTITNSAIGDWMIGDFSVQGYSTMAIDPSAEFTITVTNVTQTSTASNGQVALSGTAEPQVTGPDLAGGINAFAQFTASAGTAFANLATTGADGVLKSIATGGAYTNGASLVGSLLSGVVNSFTGAGTSPTFNIKLDGTVNTTGLNVSSSPATTITCFLNTINNSSNNTLAYPHALNNISWGVLDFNRTQIPYDINYDNPEAPYQHWTVPVNYIGSNLTINPAIAGDISSIQAQIDGDNYTDGNGHPLFRPLSDVDAYSYDCGEGIPFIRLKITFKDGSVLYQFIRPY